MTFAIAGVSGNTGKVVAEALLASGRGVRVLVRDAAKGAAWKARGAEVVQADLADADALTRALRDVEGAYLLQPPNATVARFRAFQDDISRSLATAVEKSGVPHVVLLSSIGAQHERGTGPIAGLHTTEALLSKIPTASLSSLRAGYFIDNFASVLQPVRDAGVLPSFFPASHRVTMIGTRDIGRLAAQLLLEGAKQHQVVELGTEHTTDEVAAALSKLLEKPVRIEEVPLEAVAPALRQAGFSEDRAELYREMTAGIRSGRVAFEGRRRVEASEPLEQSLAALLGR